MNTLAMYIGYAVLGISAFLGTLLLLLWIVQFLGSKILFQARGVEYVVKMMRKIRLEDRQARSSRKR